MKSTQLNNRILICFTSISLLSGWSCTTQKNAETIISIDAGKIENHVTPYLYGSCIEDVNHEIYGGLYDQKIFGESFEEPAPSPVFNDFSVYEGSWDVNNNQELSVREYAGAKLVYNPIEINNGSVETEIKFDANNGDNAGLIVNVTSPGNGADSFYGYEISLNANGKKIVLGKHKNNFEHIRDIEVDCNPIVWNRLKVEMNDGKIEISLNNKSVFIYNDNNASLKSGRIGLRTWNSNVKFRNTKIETGKLIQTLAFKTAPSLNISSQWDAIQANDVKAVFTLDNKNAYNGSQSQVIEYISGTGNAGVSNASLNRWGIAVKKNQQFQGRIYLKTPNLKSPVIVALQSADGKNTYASQEINNVTNNWSQYPFNLTANTTDTNARFAVYISRPGKLWIDMVTLMNTPGNQFKELPFRKDIGEMMVKQKITFLRYGGSMVNVPGYRFKKMIGDPDKRPPYAGNWYPYSTNGFGIEDFLKFNEAAGFTAAFAINIEESPEDVADMIEYLNGPSTSTWGKKRAENGHAAPYHVKYIEIGNEEVLPGGDNAEAYDHYIKRFNLLYNAIKSKDTSISLIGAAWWRPESPNMEKVFKAMDGKASYWDYHPWADKLTSGQEVEKGLKQMQALFFKWNPATTMKCAIFEENGNLHNIQRVLGHVTLQNAVRRMGDFVFISCPANALQPYQQNDNGWDQGQIFFTPHQVWGMPPFYAQQMASSYHLPLRIQSSVNSETLDITATRDENGNTIVLHVANIHDKPVTASLDMLGLDAVKMVKAIYLTGKLDDVNTPQEPEKIIPKEKQLNYKKNMNYLFEPYSYTILVFTLK